MRAGLSTIEDRGIFIVREAYTLSKNLALLGSMGWDSTVASDNIAERNIQGLFVPPESQEAAL